MKKNTVKLKFTDIEFSMLADLVYVGEWVVNGSRTPDKIVFPYKQMQERISNILAVEETVKKHVEAGGDIEELFERRMAMYMKEFSEKNLYDTLAAKLSLFHHPSDSLAASLADEKYSAELSKNGLKNIVIHCEKKPR